ncbi:hypothetical protein KJ564_08170 [bacterium]|nr:hypothetical protein [bacterium]MBU1882547.1 hypothetical protein [bacterium]
MSNGASISAAIVAKQRREIIQAFRNAGATSAETAQTLETLGLHNSVILTVQKARGVLVEAGEGRFNLDEKRTAEVAAKRRKLVLSLLVVMIIAILYSWYSGN